MFFIIRKIVFPGLGVQTFKKCITDVSASCVTAGYAGLFYDASFLFIVFYCFTDLFNDVIKTNILVDGKPGITMNCKKCGKSTFRMALIFPTNTPHF